MATVALVVHQHRAEAAAVAADAAAWLAARGHEVRVPAGDATGALAPWATPPDELSVGLDVAVSLGGDGTMLRTVRLVGAEDVPVIGVNFGQLGYLTQVEPEGVVVALKRFLTGAYHLEERMLLDVRMDAAESPIGGIVPPALNEAVLEKTPSGHTVRLDVWIDGEYFTTYAADGVIVATPTGSTAYAFSARGPIVEPTHRAMLLTPVSPHMLFDRTLVLAATTSVRLEVAGDRPATLSVDGWNLGELRAGDAIECTGATRVARLVTFGNRDFHRILKGKFGLSDR